MKNTNEFSFILKPSKIKGAGIGVFVLHDIAPEVLLAIKPSSHIARIVNKQDVPIELLEYCIENKDGTYDCPPEFNHMHLVWYLNHSNSPNAELRDEEYYSTLPIKTGEEIVIDYKKFNEPSFSKKM